ncbi:MAG: cytochrome P450 [Sandaracinaceae bacterium]
MALVSPMPAVLRGRVPVVGAGIELLRDPTAALEAARAKHGDTFYLSAFGLPLFFVFSPEGLRSLYALPERDASFTEATRTLLGFKLPEELTAGDMGMFHRLFGKDRRQRSIEHIVDAVDGAIDRLNRAGELEAFTHMKALVHRVGFRSWAGHEAASDRHLARLVRLFEQLDPEEAFVRPSSIFVTLLTKKQRERAALREVAEILTEIHRARPEADEPRDMLDELHASYRALPREERELAVARDVVILHLASLSNLYAAMAWTLVNALARPSLQRDIVAELAAARAEHGPDYLLDERVVHGLAALEACAYESIRFAQQSITLRKVVNECTLDDGEREYRLAPGVYIATLLSVTNRERPPLDRFDAAHYDKGRLSSRVALPTKETVSTFGHGIHACPGQRFAIGAIKVAVARHLDRLELTPRFGAPRIAKSQIGAVGRADAPCPIGFRRR